MSAGGQVGVAHCQNLTGVDDTDDVMVLVDDLGHLVFAGRREREGGFLGHVDDGEGVDQVHVRPDHDLGFDVHRHPGVKVPVDGGLGELLPEVVRGFSLDEVVSGYDLGHGASLLESTDQRRR